MKRISALITACAALALATAVPASASTRHCKAVNTPTGTTSTITAKNVSCTTARKVAKGIAVHGHYTGWKYSAKQYQGGATITARRGTMRVIFQQSD